MARVRNWTDSETECLEGRGDRTTLGFLSGLPFFLRGRPVIACARISVYDTQPVAGPSTPNAPYLKNDIRSAVYMVPNVHCLEVFLVGVLGHVSSYRRPCEPGP